MQGVYTLILLLIILYFSSYATLQIPYEEKKREKYYSKIIEESIHQSKELELNYDENGFYLTNINPYNIPKHVLAVINKKHIISGCEFYPFKDYILGLVVQYVNHYFSINSVNTINREVAIPLLTTVYYMLYLRFGDKERAEKFYTLKLKQTTSEFTKFELRHELKEYMLNMPLESDTCFYFNEEDLSLSRRLGLSLSSYDLAIGVYNHILEGVNEIKDKVFRDSILPIVSQKEYFKKYFDYTFRKGTEVSVDEYQNIYSETVAEEYTQYQIVIKEKFQFKNEKCITIFPLIDLLRPLNENIHSKYALHLTVRPQLGFEFALDNMMQNSNSRLGITHGIAISDEELYIHYGLKMKSRKDLKSQVLLPFTFNRKDFTLKKARICKSIGCGGFDIEKFWMVNTTAQNYSFVINEDVNFSLLNIFKLINMVDSKIDEEFVTPSLLSFYKFDYQFETKALSRYINLLFQVYNSNLDHVN